MAALNNNQNAADILKEMQELSAQRKAIDNSSQKLLETYIELQNAYTMNDGCVVPRMLTLKEAVEISGISYEALRRLCFQKKIVHTRIGSKVFINAPKFVDYLNRTNTEDVRK